MNEIEAYIYGWEKFFWHKISRLTPWRVANNYQLGKEFLIYLGTVKERPIYPFEEKSRLEALARYGMEGRLGYVEYCTVQVVDGTWGNRVHLVVPHPTLD